MPPRPALVGDLNDAERIFVREIGKGSLPNHAAELAGLDPTDSWNLLRRPRIATAVHAEVQRALTQDAPISLKVLKKLRDDESTPARTRADISLKLLQMAGYGAESHQTAPDKQLAEMSSDELAEFLRRGQAEIDRLETELASRAKDVSAAIPPQGKAKPPSFLD